MSTMVLLLVVAAALAIAAAAFVTFFLLHLDRRLFVELLDPHGQEAEDVLVRRREDSHVSEWSTFGPSRSDPSFEPFDRLTDELHSSVRISKQMHRKVKGIEQIRLKREQADRISASVRGRSSSARCPSVGCHRINSSMNVETVNSFSRLPAIRTMGFRSARIVLFRSFSRRWRCGKSAKRFAFIPPPRCWKHSVCTKVGKNIAV